MATVRNQKIKLLLIPYLFTSLFLIGIYTFLNWLLFYKLNIFSLNAGIPNFVIPLVLPFVPIIFYLRPRLKVFSALTIKQVKIHMYILVLWVFLAPPLIISQYILERGIGELTQIDNIDEIDQYRETRYYAVKNYFADHSASTEYFKIDTTINMSKSKQKPLKFNLYMYFVVPILKNNGDSLQNNNINWLAYEYFGSVVEDDKNVPEKIKRFIKESRKSFSEISQKKLTYLDRVPDSFSLDGIKMAINASQGYKSKNYTAFYANHEPFEKRITDLLILVFGIIALGALILFIMISIPKFKDNSEEFEDAFGLK